MDFIKPGPHPLTIIIFILLYSPFTLVSANTCRYIRAKPNDGCEALAGRCGITVTELEKYNPAANFCSSILVDEVVCCSEGTLPDLTPQPNPDGSCVAYTVKKGDTCSSIAESKGMTIADIRARNHQTWGWSDCELLTPDQVICVSIGTPPMPGSIPNAICGPQVPGTPKPDNMSTLASLNPCVLNGCCDNWGQCGNTEEFCTPNPSDTGAPGSRKPGTISCISNCGTNITNNKVAPFDFRHIGYFEASNMERPCLHMAVSNCFSL